MIRNLAELFFNKSAEHPQKPALIFPTLSPGGHAYQEELLTFSELAVRSRLLQSGLKSRGIAKGSVVLLLTPLSPNLYALIIALMALGAIPLFVDPAMGWRRLYQVISTQRPQALVSTPKIWAWRFLLPALWRLEKYTPQSLQEILGEKRMLPAQPEISPMADQDTALITFTTGSTGAPKGADRNFKILRAQHELSRKYWPETPDEVDMPCFPMITLQNMACGITTILPAINWSHPSSVDPSLVVQQILHHQVTRLSGSPAYLKKVLEYVEKQKISLPSVRRLIAGGAAVPRSLCELAERTLPHSENVIVYGSTEVEPISFTPMREAVQNSHQGFLVGSALPELEIKIVKDLTNNLGEFTKYGPELYATDEIGEVLVRGPHVIERYIGSPQANRETKLKDPKGQIWHRTGDLAYLDEDQRLVLVGRLKDQIQSQLGPVANYLIEKKLEEIPGVARAGVLNSKQGPVTFVQASQDQPPLEVSQKVENVLRQFYLSNSKITWIPEMPVDHRHQWKVDREKLRSDHL